MTNFKPKTLLNSVTEEEEYRALIRNLRRRDGFGLLFVHCLPAQEDKLFKQIQADIPNKKIGFLKLEESIDNLYDILEERQQQTPLDILLISGIEKSLVEYIKPGIGGQGDYYKLDTVPRLLNHLNLQRERFRDELKICLVFLVPKFALKYLIRRAPDFFDWRSGVYQLVSDPDKLELESLRVVLEGDYQKYLSWTEQQRQEKILTIKELIEEKHQTDERKSKLWFEIGNLFLAGKNNEEAIASFDQALKIKLDYHQAWNNRGNALKNLGNYSEAIASYDQALKIKPDYHQAWYNRGIALGNLGNYEAAIASYDQALKIKPDYHQAWYNKAFCYALQGKTDLAIELNPDECREMAKTDSDFDSIRSNPQYQALIF